MTFLAKPNRVSRVGKLCGPSTEHGFSLIELLIVLAIISILTTYSLFALSSNRNLYRTDDQAMRILNLMRQASQRALTRRQRMRLEIDVTNNLARVVDENGAPGDAAQHRTVAQETLDQIANVRISATTTNISQPTNVTVIPVANHNPLTFTAASGGSLKWSVYFRNDGTVTDASNNPVSATLMMWQPLNAATPNTAKNPATVRALTVFSGSGAIRLWKYTGTTFVRG